MADKDFEIGGSSTFKRRWVDLGNNVYAAGVALLSMISGEDPFNHRLKVENQPADEDSVLEILQNAAVTTGVGTAINVKGFKSVSFRVSAGTGAQTWAGGFQATIDDTNWLNICVVNAATNAEVDAANTHAAPPQFNPAAAVVDDLYYLPSVDPAWSQIRFNISARTNGTINVTSRKTPR